MTFYILDICTSFPLFAASCMELMTSDILRRFFFLFAMISILVHKKYAYLQIPAI